MTTTPKRASDTILSLLGKVTKKWTKQRKREERDANARRNRDSFGYHVTVKEVVEDELPAAYAKASDNGKYPANARQIYYAIREPVQQQNTHGRPLKPGYFSQQLLPDYIKERDLDWDVVYDDRGHFYEPHGESGPLGLGTINVRNYCAHATGPTLNEEIAIEPAKINLHGPEHHYAAVLYIEKEGFMPLFEQEELAKRYDLAIVSGKGFSVTAARRLVDTLCAKYDIPLLILHDFDFSGFIIAATLRRDTRRYEFKNPIRVVDLGLRWADIKGLPTEEYVPPGYRKNPDGVRRTLEDNGATPEEIEFLLHQRVELNAFTSDAFMRFVEKKLRANGIKKVIPDEEWLERLYRRAVKGAMASERLEKILEELDDEQVKVPADLDKKVRRYLKKHPAASWHDAVRNIAEPNSDAPPAAPDDNPPAKPGPKKAHGEQERGSADGVASESFESLIAAAEEAVEQLDSAEEAVNWLDSVKATPKKKSKRARKGKPRGN